MCDSTVACTKYPSTDVPRHNAARSYPHGTIRRRARMSFLKYDTLLLDLSVKRDSPCVQVPHW